VQVELNVHGCAVSRAAALNDEFVAYLRLVYPPVSGECLFSPGAEALDAHCEGYLRLACDLRASFEGDSPAASAPALPDCGFEERCRSYLHHADPTSATRLATATAAEAGPPPVAPAAAPHPAAASSPLPPDPDAQRASRQRWAAALAHLRPRLSGGASAPDSAGAFSFSLPPSRQPSGRASCPPSRQPSEDARQPMAAETEAEEPREMCPVCYCEPADFIPSCGHATCSDCAIRMLRAACDDQRSALDASGFACVQRCERRIGPNDVEPLLTDSASSRLSAIRGGAPDPGAQFGGRGADGALGLSYEEYERFCQFVLEASIPVDERVHCPRCERASARADVTTEHGGGGGGTSGPLAPALETPRVKELESRNLAARAGRESCGNVHDSVDNLVRAFNLASTGNLAELRPLIFDRRVAVDVVRPDGLFRGYTLIHAAASKGHVEVVEFLLSAGASPDVLNAQGKTALALARDKNHLAIVAIFERARGLRCPHCQHSWRPDATDAQGPSTTATDAYIGATSRRCPNCDVPVTKWHGHSCHHISPQTNGCPNCHQHFCYVCLHKHGRPGERAFHSECAHRQTFCRLDDIGLHLGMEPYPHDVRCGCPICPDCRRGVPCELCDGGCVVCRGLVPPGPTELATPAAACTVAGCVVHDEAAAARCRRREAELQRAERQRPAQGAEVYHAVVPEGVTTLGAGYFRGRRDLRSVALPASLTRIGDRAFEDFHSLTLEELPASLTSIGIGAFRGCSSLALRELPASLTSIGDRAFAGCSSLALRELPASLTSIGDDAFDGCSSLALRELPASLTSIGHYAFFGCSSLALGELPASLTSIGDGAFDGCSSLALR